MGRSFGIVEEKLREGEFFLDQLRQSSRLSYEARFYFSAFISASRSVTFAMQASMSDTTGFLDWYKTAQARLKTDQLAPLFVELRNEVVHVGSNPLDVVTLDHLKQDLAQQMSGHRRSHTLIVPDPEKLGATMLVDAVAISTTYFASLVRVVYDCYSEFRCIVDPRWHYTERHFTKLGKTFEDAVEELGFPRSWADCAPIGPDRWRVLRLQQPPCQVNDLFDKYLQAQIPDPDDAPGETAEV